MDLVRVGRFEFTPGLTTAPQIKALVFVAPKPRPTHRPSLCCSFSCTLEIDPSCVVHSCSASNSECFPLSIHTGYDKCKDMSEVISTQNQYC